MRTTKMITFSEYLTFMSKIINPIIDLVLIAALVIIIIAIIITELMKAFNPTIDTSEQAVEHIVSKLKNYEPNEEEEQYDVPETNVFLFLFMPIIGVAVVLAVIRPLFPIFGDKLIDFIMKYYIEVLPYFAIFVGLYYLGSVFIRLGIWGAYKFGELLEVTVKIIKKEIKEDES